MSKDRKRTTFLRSLSEVEREGQIIQALGEISRAVRERLDKDGKPALDSDGQLRPKLVLLRPLQDGLIEEMLYVYSLDPTPTLDLKARGHRRWPWRQPSEPPMPTHIVEKIRWNAGTRKGNGRYETDFKFAVYPTPQQTLDILTQNPYAPPSLLENPASEGFTLSMQIQSWFNIAVSPEEET